MLCGTQRLAFEGRKLQKCSINAIFFIKKAVKNFVVRK